MAVAAVGKLRISFYVNITRRWTRPALAADRRSVHPPILVDGMRIMIRHPLRACGLDRRTAEAVMGANQASEAVLVRPRGLTVIGPGQRRVRLAWSASERAA